MANGGASYKNPIFSFWWLIIMKRFFSQKYFKIRYISKILASFPWASFLAYPENQNIQTFGKMDLIQTVKPLAVCLFFYIILKYIYYNFSKNGYSLMSILLHLRNYTSHFFFLLSKTLFLNFPSFLIKRKEIFKNILYNKFTDLSPFKMSYVCRLLY